MKTLNYHTLKDFFFTGAHTNKIERLWRTLKDLIPKYGRVGKHFEGYLARAIFLSKIKNPNHRFHEFLLAAGREFAPKYVYFFLTMVCE